MTDDQTHWNDTYSSKGDNVSWYQPPSSRSLELIRSAAPMHNASIIDIGAGASRLADSLLTAGYTDVTLLDISEIALGRTRDRLGEAASKVRWIVANISQWKPSRTWDVWHDRAVFHFLTDEAARSAYLTALRRSVAPGGTVILATFAADGPTQCSGLQVARYDANTLSALFGSEFERMATARDMHVTPWGSIQAFTYLRLRRRE